MTLARRIADLPLTIAEFDAIVERAGDDARLYELIGGVVTMMTNPSRRHETIVTNIVTSLGAPVRKRGCTMFIGGMRVQREAAGSGLDKVKPDIAVRCGPSTRDDNLLNFITDPVVIVEVLSPSTIDYDGEDPGDPRRRQTRGRRRQGFHPPLRQPGPDRDGAR